MPRAPRSPLPPPAPPAPTHPRGASCSHPTFPAGFSQGAGCIREGGERAAKPSLGSFSSFAQRVSHTRDENSPCPAPRGARLAGARPRAGSPPARPAARSPTDPAWTSRKKKKKTTRVGNREKRERFPGAASPRNAQLGQRQGGLAALPAGRGLRARFRNRASPFLRFPQTTGAVAGDPAFPPRQLKALLVRRNPGLVPEPRPQLPPGPVIPFPSRAAPPPTLVPSSPGSGPAPLTSFQPLNSSCPPSPAPPRRAEGAAGLHRGGLPPPPRRGAS